MECTFQAKIVGAALVFQYTNQGLTQEAQTVFACLLATNAGILIHIKTVFCYLDFKS